MLRPSHHLMAVWYSPESRCSFKLVEEIAVIQEKKLRACEPCSPGKLKTAENGMRKNPVFETATSAGEEN